MKAEGALTQSLGRLFAVAEGYPDLKANQNMLQLQEELTSTENRIGFSRQAYNDAVMKHEQRHRAVPDERSSPAWATSSRASSSKSTTPEERKAVKVSF